MAVLTEALTRDEVARRRALGDHVRKSQIRESVKAFIQNVHHFRDDGLRDSGPPIDHVVIFDEAQRAWNREQTAKFMRAKKKLSNFEKSEPEFLISYLDRHKDWAVVVCLVGGGQEIHTGEAGIGAWLEAINAAFPQWHVYISPDLKDSEYTAGHALDAIRERPHVTLDEDCIWLSRCDPFALRMFQLSSRRYSIVKWTSHGTRSRDYAIGIPWP